MYEITILLTQILATLTLLGHIGLAVLIIYLIIRLLSKWRFGLAENILALIKQHSVLFVFLVAITGMLLSLYYSELAQFPPCELCWWQRIFLYPQAFIFGTTLIIKAKKVQIYGIVLSIFGWLIAGYQYILQLNQIFGGSPILPVPCNTNGAVSCSHYYFFEYGYITMPMMSLTAFTFILVILLIHRYYRK